MHWRWFRVAKGGQRVAMVAEDEEGGTNCCFPSRESRATLSCFQSAGFSSLETGFKPLYHPRRLSFPNIPWQFSTRRFSTT